MAAITICSDFGAQKNSLTLFPLSPHLFPMKFPHLFAMKFPHLFAIYLTRRFECCKILEKHNFHVKKRNNFSIALGKMGSYQLML